MVFISFMVMPGSPAEVWRETCDVKDQRADPWFQKRKMHQKNNTWQLTGAKYIHRELLLLLMSLGTWRTHLLCLRLVPVWLSVIVTQQTGFHCFTWQGLPEACLILVTPAAFISFREMTKKLVDLLAFYFWNSAFTILVLITLIWQMKINAVGYYSRWCCSWHDGSQAVHQTDIHVFWKHSWPAGISANRLCMTDAKNK